jgi:glycosyltransferase involved in cell wall biosynthesis
VHAVVNGRKMLRPTASPWRGTISVLIPARDEAWQIGACLDAIDGADEVLVLDDDSSDRTAAVAAAHGATVLRGTSVPAGDFGKPHACRRLAAAAHGDVLVFLDADVRLAPGAVRAAAALLESSGLDLISPLPRQVAVTPAERLVQPLLAWSILTLLPQGPAVRSSRASLAAANGQFLVVRKTAYERAGGHPVRAVLDDLALLRAIKRSGGHGVAVAGFDLASCRMYSGWGEVRDGYGKSLWAAFGGPAGSAAVVGALAMGYLLPAVAALRGSRIGLIGYAAGVLGRVVTGRRAGDRVWPDALAHPVSIAVFGYLTARSHVGRRRGTVRWKGRPVR